MIDTEAIVAEKGQPTTLLQISMRSLEQYAEDVITEAEAYGVKESTLQELRSFLTENDPEAVTWTIDQTLDAIREQGHTVIEDNDHLYIW